MTLESTTAAKRFEKCKPLSTLPNRKNRNTPMAWSQGRARLCFNVSQKGWMKTWCVQSLWAPLSGRSRWVTATLDRSLVHPGLGQQKKVAPYTLVMLDTIQAAGTSPTTWKHARDGHMFDMIYDDWFIHLLYIQFYFDTVHFPDMVMVPPSPSSSGILPFCLQWGVDCVHDGPTFTGNHL